VNGGLGGAVGGGEGQRDEGEAGGDGDDGGVGLLKEVREQRGGEADGAEEVGSDDGLGVGGVRGLEDVFGAHDAGVVDDDVKRGVVGGELLGEGADAGGVFDVEDGGGHAGVGCDGLVEDLLAAAGDDDLVAEFMEGLCDAAADARAAAGDEDGVSGGFHGGDFTRLGELVGGISQKMLTKTVRQMERDGLVTRTVHPVIPPRVEYELTELGRSLGEAFCGVWIWVGEHSDEIEPARKMFEGGRRAG
jgi:DNA-binding HxlR family transcriptional regulator